MEPVYVGQEFPARFRKAIMLVGPTPRKSEIPSWRPEALRFLKELGYDGGVFIPEREDGTWRHNYDDQVETEERMLNMADCIVCWIPRDMATMPALTTNDEWGTWKYSGKVVLGTPEQIAGTQEKTPHVSYQRYYARKLDIPCHATLQDTLQAALEMLGDGALREGGECEVPLHVWRTALFQRWYANLRAAGNRLDGARVEWVFRIGQGRKLVFYWALHANIFVAAENRHKDNEVVLGRPDISAVVGYRHAPKIEDSQIVLIREFRSSVSNILGYVYELPGGSSWNPEKTARMVAVSEWKDETGLAIEESRLREHDSRQLMATLSAHHAHLFSVELTEAEIKELRGMAGVARGVVEDTERTYVEVRTVGEILDQKSVLDWSMIGMILSVLCK